MNWAGSLIVLLCLKWHMLKEDLNFTSVPSTCNVSSCESLAQHTWLLPTQCWVLPMVSYFHTVTCKPSSNLLLNKQIQCSKYGLEPGFVPQIVLSTTWYLPGTLRQWVCAWPQGYHGVWEWLGSREMIQDVIHLFDFCNLICLSAINCFCFCPRCCDQQLVWHICIGITLSILISQSFLVMYQAWLWWAWAMEILSQARIQGLPKPKAWLKLKPRLIYHI